MFDNIVFCVFRGETTQNRQQPYGLSVFHKFQYTINNKKYSYRIIDNINVTRVYVLVV